MKSADFKFQNKIAVLPFTKGRLKQAEFTTRNFYRAWCIGWLKSDGFWITLMKINYVLAPFIHV